MRSVKCRMVLPYGGHSQLLDFRLLQTFRFCTSILKPDFHLKREEENPPRNKKLLKIALRSIDYKERQKEKFYKYDDIFLIG